MNRFYLYYFIMSMFLFSCANESEKPATVDFKNTSKINVQEESMENKEDSSSIEEITPEVEIKDQVVIEKTKSESEIGPNSSSQKIISKPSQKKKSPPVISFEKNNFDFGRIVQGEMVLHEFVFKNNGDEPLVIKNAEASCGCTKPVYPFIPIEAGEKGSILVQFNSTGRLGRQSANINVISNATRKVIALHLAGEVVTEKYQDTIK